MSEERIIELLLKRHSGSLSPSEEEELNRYLVKDPDSIYKEEYISQLWKSINFDRTNNALESHSKQFQEQFIEINEERLEQINMTQTNGKNKKDKLLIYFGTATIVVLLLFLTSVYFDFSKRTTNNITEIRSERGIRKELHLPDGTKVWLNADSKMSFDFSSESIRKVFLEGEAFFDVAKRADSPFLIETKEMTVRVLGTSFNIKAYPTDGISEATLISGAVELSFNRNPKEKIRLRPNEKISFSKPLEKTIKKTAIKKYKITLGHLSKINLENEELIQEISWTKNRLIFSDEPMRTLIPKLERWYNIHIQVLDPAIYEKKFTGSVVNEDISHMLTALQLIDYFDFKLNGNDVILF